MPLSTAAGPSRSRARRWWRGVLYLGAFGFVLGNLWIEARARGRVFTDLGEVPTNDVGLVLGTSPRVRGGGENPFFAGRMDAAAALYLAGKVRRLIVSGDNRSVGYDEPTAMRQSLVQRGVPETAITLDYAGFRTLDSMARAKQVFGANRLTIVTDDFHASRSILLARYFEIDAVLFCSKPVPLKWSIKTRVREIGARGQALLDLYVLHRQPHFFGRPFCPTSESRVQSRCQSHWRGC
ncbi:MAG: ElyC/SanA/YdcF family protein [Chthoniobacterales bacterium]